MMHDKWTPPQACVLRNGLYNIGGQVVRGLVSLLTIPILIRFLGIREYGVWSLAYAVLLFITISEAAFSVTAAVFLSRDLAENDSNEAGKTLGFLLFGAATISVLLGLLLWTCGFVVVRPLIRFSLADRLTAGHALKVAGLAVSSLIIERTLIGIEQAFDRYATINALDLFQSLLINCGAIAVAWLGGGVIQLMKWQVVAIGILTVAHCCVVYRLLRGRRLRLGWSRHKSIRMLKYSVAAWTSAIGSAVFGQCDQLVVGGVLGAPALGVYAAITGITSKINSFSGTAVQPLVPALNSDKSSEISVSSRLREAAQLNALIAIEAGIILYVLADWVARIMIPGTSASEVIVGLQIATVIYVLYSLNAPGHFVLFSIGEASLNAIVTLCSAVASLVLIFEGARHFGLLGAVAGNVAYWGTLSMVALGLKKTRAAAIGSYIGWIAVPLAAFGVAFVCALVLEDFWWRLAFVSIQSALLVLWFVREQSRAGKLAPEWWRTVSERGLN